MEAVSDYLARVGDRDERTGFVYSDIVSECYRLTAAHDGYDDRFFFLFIAAGRTIGGNASVQTVHYVVGYRLGSVADYRKYLTEVDIFDNAVDHERFCKETAKAVESGLDVEYDERGQRDYYIDQHKGR